MTDRELLELAAKSAGIKCARWSNGFGGLVGNQDDRPIIWNPLTGDADAFRLAVRLRIDLGEGIDKEPCAWVSYSIGDKLKSINEHYGDDPYSATRRAIVRAAAEIGKSMEPS
ncbi:MAG TPA: hypothetical protein DD666_00625 [Advenella kashmirensis]|uniref:Phage ABA sandwich domain-containing protein n=1 Tax=Advenella kashmirensis TaxID=310575 RepID=A0A356LA87_9BURK|nr:hypothetical protein [Advenella kashmirensis]